MDLGRGEKEHSLKTCFFSPEPADFTNMAAMPQQIRSDNELVNFPC